jgi:hypothetical protein
MSSDIVQRFSQAEVATGLHGPVEARFGQTVLNPERHIQACLSDVGLEGHDETLVGEEWRIDAARKIT